MNRNIDLLIRFITTYCDHNHLGREKSIYSSPYIKVKEQISLCEHCRQLADYSIQKRINCPLKGKTSCKKCHIKCYKAEYRDQIRKVMKFSGIYYIKRGRLDFIFKYFF